MGAFVHFFSGWLCKAAVWEPLIVELGLPPGGYRVHDWREVLTEGLPPAGDGSIWVGHSLGALRVLEFLASSGQGVRAVLLGATARLAAAEDYPGADPRACAAMRRRLRSDAAGLVRDFAAAACLPDVCKAEWFEEPAADCAEGLVYLQETDARAGLCGDAAADCRVALVHGREDGIVPLASAQRLPFECRVVEGGHMAPLMRPEAAADLIRNWL